MKHNVVSLVAVALGGAMASPLFAADAAFCDGRVSDREERSVPYMDKPAYMETYTDPVFGSAVTRITNAKSGGVVKTMYNTVQAWNIDESYLVLYHTGTEGAAHHLYDGRTYEHIRKLDIVVSDLEEVFWDPQSANHLFYIQKYPVTDAYYDTLVRYNVETGEKQVVTDLGQICGHPESAGGSAIAGYDVQAIYGDHVGVRCNNNAFEGTTSDRTFLVNVHTGEVSAQVTIDPTLNQYGLDYNFAYTAAAAATPSNRYMLLQGAVLDWDGNLVRQIDQAYNSFVDSNGTRYNVPNPEHSSVGRLPNGHDAFYSASYDPYEGGCDGSDGVGSIVVNDVETGDCRVVVGPDTGWSYPQSGTHLSAISEGAPGWVAMSTIGYGSFGYFSNNKPAPTLFSEVSLTFADEDDPQTCRLAHTRTYAKDAENASGYTAPYFGEPHPVISPSGTRILFSSDWYDSGSVDTYVIDLTVEADASVIAAAAPESVGEEEEDEVAQSDTDGTEDDTAGSDSDDDATEEETVAGNTGDELVTLPSPDKDLAGSETEAEEEEDTAEEVAPEEDGSDAESESGDASETEAEAFAGSFASSKPVYTMGERVYIDFAGIEAPAGDDWVSIAPVGSPDGQLNMWLYTNGTQTVTAEGPVEGRLGFYSEYIGIGDYEARLFLNGSSVPTTRVAFEVTEAAAPETELSTSAQSYVFGDTVEVFFSNAEGSGADWISIAPVGSPDAEMRMWIYTHGTQTVANEGPLEGSVSFYSEYIGVGEFEARYFANDGTEASARTTFTVTEAPTAQLTTSKAVYEAGEQVEVNFSGLPGSGADWISIAPVGSPDGEMRMWIYAHGTQTVAEEGPTEGSVSFYSEYIGVGEFEARVFLNDGSEAVNRVTFEITDQPVASLETTQTLYGAGDKVVVNFSDLPGGGADWISIAPAGSPDGQMLMWIYTNGTQTASDEGPVSGTVSFYSEYIGIGDFEARLFFNDGNTVQARHSFSISEAPVGEPVITDKDVYAEGEDVIVSFDQAPGNGTDWVCISPAGAEVWEMVLWNYTNGTQSGTAESPVSGELVFDGSYLPAGEYEARIFYDDTYELAASYTFRVE
ncbi:hypothetical protein Q4485_13680 [Granulosicoccaceae sp. 1_MG-2023]|nr:hypothetical protein [Granulosicoccaceae sp. 1_MG-2023]